VSALGGRLRAATANVRRHHWQLLGLAIATGGGYAWFGMGHDARASTEAAVIQAQSPEAMAAASATVLVAAPSAREAASAEVSAPIRAPAASATVASRAASPREICAVGKSSGIDECIKRVCKTEARFKHSETCLRLQRQPRPWWKIFHSS